MSRIPLIIVEDDTALRESLGRELTAAGFEIKSFPSAEGVVEACREFRPDVALVDLKLPGKSGLELLRELKDDVQVVILTGHGGVPEAVEAMRLGAYDFLTKPTRFEVLEKAVRRASERSRLLGENARLRRAIASSGKADELIGDSPQVEELRQLISRVGPVEAAVLIEGENGTGKELVARQLHRASMRADKPMLVLNCGAMPAELVESELFGHVRGAFTGAEKQRVGMFEAAAGGTLVLDEVGELPRAAQPALLRTLQFGEIRPVGSSATKTVDVRVVAATNRDLAQEVDEGRFREDLFHRLSTFRIRVPPLRERPQDIGLLARMFLARASAKTGRKQVLGDDAIERLSAENWRGNVRELQNAITRLSVLAPGEVITRADVDAIASGDALLSRQSLPTLNIAELERLATEAAMARHHGDKRAAAEELGVSLRTLYNRLEKYGVPGPDGLG